MNNLLYAFGDWAGLKEPTLIGALRYERKGIDEVCFVVGVTLLSLTCHDCKSMRVFGDKSVAPPMIDVQVFLNITKEIK